MPDLGYDIMPSADWWTACCWTKALCLAIASAVLTWAAVHLGKPPCAKPEGCAAATPAGCHADCRDDYQADADPAAAESGTAELAVAAAGPALVDWRSGDPDAAAAAWPTVGLLAAEQRSDGWAGWGHADWGSPCHGPLLGVCLRIPDAPAAHRSNQPVEHMGVSCICIAVLHHCVAAAL